MGEFKEGNVVILFKWLGVRVVELTQEVGRLVYCEKCKSESEFRNQKHWETIVKKCDESDGQIFRTDFQNSWICTKWIERKATKREEFLYKVCGREALNEV